MKFGLLNNKGTIKQGEIIMSQKHSIYKNPEADLRLSYRRVLEKSFIVSLLIMIFLFLGFRDSGLKTDELESFPALPTEVIHIPITEQLKPLPKPDLPRIPIEAEDDEFAEAATISTEKIDFEKLIKDSAPPDTEPEPEDFWAVQQRPELIKMSKPVYPEMAQRAGLEGDVVLKVLVGKKGSVEKVEIIKSAPMFDTAAIAAAWKCKYRPGKQRDKFVKVWCSLPFKFRLRSR
jgi:protein TonB